MRRRRHDAYRSLLALGDRPTDGCDLLQDFVEIVAAAAYDLGIEDRIEVRPQEGPSWLTQGLEDDVAGAA